MKHQVSSDQYSLLRFERVWVREAAFVDAEGELTPLTAGELKGLGIDLELKVAYSPNRDQAHVTLRATLRPPPGKDWFQKLSAAVEGAFAVSPGAEKDRLEQFATLQAPVLLVPYVREVITTLTAQSRLGALILPPLNMAEIIKAMRGETARGEVPAAEQP